MTIPRIADSQWSREAGYAALLSAAVEVSSELAESADAIAAARIALRALVERCGAVESRLLLPDASGSYAPAARVVGSAVVEDPPHATYALPLRHAGRHVGLIEVVRPPDWLVEPPGQGSPLALLCAPLAPSLALTSEITTRHREAARVRSLLEATQAAVSSLALKEVLRRTMQAVRDLFGASGVAIWRLDELGALRRFGSLGLREEYVRAVTGRSAKDGVIGIALQEGRLVAVPDVRLDNRVTQGTHLLREGLRSLVIAPLLSHGRPTGALTIYYRAPRTFGAADADALAGLANQVAAAIDNALAHAATRRALSEASAQRELLDSVVRNAQDGILALDAAGRVVLFSPGCERLTGWTALAATERTLSELLRCDCCAPNAELQTIASGGYAEVHVRTRGGDARWLGVSAARVTSRRASAARTVLVLRDVTEARQVDEFKSSVVSTVSHELRTPLTSIRALSELLEDDPSGSQQAREMAGTINRESERLARLVENLLDAARLQSGRLPVTMRRVALAPLVHDAREVMERARPTHLLQVLVPDDLPAAWADPDRVRQVLDNLLDNSTKYSPPGGEISVQVEYVSVALEDSDVLGLLRFRAPGMLLVTVRDQGSGIPAAQLERVFERFHRLDGSAEGSGLGLHLSRGLVELMGGTIWAEPATGVGACFRFTLPSAVDGE